MAIKQKSSLNTTLQGILTMSPSEIRKSQIALSVANIRRKIRFEENLIDILKGGSYKFKYKVPTGNPKRPYRYFYTDKQYKDYLKTVQATKKAKQSVKNINPHNPKPVSSAPTDKGIGRDEDIKSQAPTFQLEQETIKTSGKKGLSSEPNLFGITEQTERKFINQNFQPKFIPSREIMSVGDLVTEVKSALLKEGMEARAKEWIDATYNVQSTMSNVLNLAYKFVTISSQVSNLIRKQIVKASVKDTKQELIDPSARKQILSEHGKDPETPVPRMNDIEKKESKSNENLSIKQVGEEARKLGMEQVGDDSIKFPEYSLKRRFGDIGEGEVKIELDQSKVLKEGKVKYKISVRIPDVSLSRSGKNISPEDFQATWYDNPEKAIQELKDKVSGLNQMADYLEEEQAKNFKAIGGMQKVNIFEQEINSMDIENFIQEVYGTINPKEIADSLGIKSSEAIDEDIEYNKEQIAEWKSNGDLKKENYPFWRENIENYMYDLRALEWLKENNPFGGSNLSQAMMGNQNAKGKHNVEIGIGNPPKDPPKSGSGGGDGGDGGEPQPIGQGDHGPIYNLTQFSNLRAGIDFLIRKQDGEIRGALSHPEIKEPIDLIWGKPGTGKSDGYGLSKLVKFHPEVLDDLQGIIGEMEVIKPYSKNRMNLESKTHKASVSLNWFEKEKTWLLTAFQKREALGSTIDISQASKGMTAPSSSHGLDYSGGGKSQEENDSILDNPSVKKEIDSIVQDVKSELKRRDQEQERLIKNAFPVGKIVILNDGQEQVEIMGHSVEFIENETGSIEAKLRYNVRNTYYIGKTYSVTEDDFEVPPEINPEKVNTILKSATPENRTKTSKELFGAIPNPRDKKMSKADWAKQSVDVSYDPPTITMNYFDGNPIDVKDYSDMDQSLIIPYDKTMGCGNLEAPKWMPTWDDPRYDKYRVLFSDIVINGERKYLCKLREPGNRKDNYCIMTQEQIIAMESFYLNKAKDLHKEYKFTKNPELSKYRSRPTQQGMSTMFVEQFDMLHERMFGYKPRRRDPKFREHNKAVFSHFREIAEEMKYREVDLRLGFQDAYEDSTYQKGKETSYGDSRTVNTILDTHGVMVKMQNGTRVDPGSLSQIKDSLNEVYSVYGNRKGLAKKFGLKISHSGSKRMHASKALGIFVPKYKAIGISYANINDFDSTVTLSHEFAHFMDYYIGQNSSADDPKRGRDFRSQNYASCGYGIENKIASTFRKGITDEYKQQEYWARSTECFARALECYFSIKTGRKHNERDGANPKLEFYQREVFPLIEQFFEEKNDILKSFFAHFQNKKKEKLIKKVLEQVKKSREKVA